MVADHPFWSTGVSSVRRVVLSSCCVTASDELASLASQALNPSAVRDEPLIQPSRGTESACLTQGNASVQRHLSKMQLADERGDLIRGLWSTGS